MFKPVRSIFEKCVVRMAKSLGYELKKSYRPQAFGEVARGSRVYIGCGEQTLEGYLGCDLRPLPNVTIACRAWELSQFCRDLKEIYSRHMLEHLTYYEAVLALRDWNNALGADGFVRIEVPNIRFAITQWLRSEWSSEAWSDRYSDARWGFAGLFGWQRECDPTQTDYNSSYWDVHKSGYDEQIIRFMLNEAGFHNITIGLEGFTPAQMRRRNLPAGASDGCHLIAVAYKQIQALKHVA